MFKGFLSEGGIRAPLVISGTAVTGGGRISDAVTHIMDVPATILKAANVDHPKTFEGKALQPLLENSRDGVRDPSDWIGWELFGNRAIREGDWKLLWLCKPFGIGGWQLYNLKTDPGEITDLASEQPQVRDRLVKHWRTYAETNNVILPDRSPICRAAAQAAPAH
jgi:arylsulfatase